MTPSPPDHFAQRLQDSEQLEQKNKQQVASARKQKAADNVAKARAAMRAMVRMKAAARGLDGAAARLTRTQRRQLREKLAKGKLARRLQRPGAPTSLPAFAARPASDSDGSPATPSDATLHDAWHVLAAHERRASRAQASGAFQGDDRESEESSSTDDDASSQTSEGHNAYVRTTTVSLAGGRSMTRKQYNTWREARGLDPLSRPSSKHEPRVYVQPPRSAELAEDIYWGNQLVQHLVQSSGGDSFVDPEDDDYGLLSVESLRARRQVMLLLHHS